MGPTTRPRSPSSPCVLHPAEPGVWSCADCGRTYCRNCIRPLQSFFNPAHGGYQDRTGVCPDCKGRCVDLVFVEEQRKRVQRAEEEARRRESSRQAWFAVLSLQFIAGLLYRSGSATTLLDLQYILFVYGVVRHGPWRTLEFETKVFFGRVLPFALMANVGAYIVADLSGSDLGRFLFLTPVKYAGITVLLFLAVRTLDRSAGLIDHIYRGSQEATGWTPGDRAVAYLSFAFLVCALLYFLVTGGAELAKLMGW